MHYPLDGSFQPDGHHYAALSRAMQEETADAPKNLNPPHTLKAEGASSGIYANNSTIHTTGTKVMIS